VDERIVGRRPASLSAAEAAALPLTGITAWELLFDRLQVPWPVRATQPACSSSARRAAWARS
jgi:NADPH:quinone reductase-like Zn-dependent oxidoreductase